MPGYQSYICCDALNCLPTAMTLLPPTSKHNSLADWPLHCMYYMLGRSHCEVGIKSAGHPPISRQRRHILISGQQKSESLWVAATSIKPQLPQHSCSTELLTQSGFETLIPFPMQPGCDLALQALGQLQCVAPFHILRKLGNLGCIICIPAAL